MDSFAALYGALVEAVPVAELLGQVAHPEWLAFLRAHRAVLELTRRPAELFVSLAQAHGSGSIISQEADAWLEQHQPAHPWLRHASRSEQAPPPPPTILAHDGGAVMALAVSADGRLAVSGGHDDSLRVWELPGGECRAVRRYSGCVSRVALGSHLVVLESTFQCTSTVRVLDWETLECVAEHRPAAYVLDLLLEGEDIYFAGWDKQVWRWKWQSGELRGLPGAHDDHVTALARHGPYLVSGSADGQLFLRDLGSGRLLRSIAAHTDRIDHLVSTSSGLLSSGYDGLLKLWDLEKANCLRDWPLRPNSQSPLAVSADGQRAVVANAYEVLVLDLKTGERRTVESGVESVSSVALTPDDRYVLCGSIAAVRVWDLHSVQRLPPPRNPAPEGSRLSFQSLAFTPDGQRVVAGTLGGQLMVWDFFSGECLAALEGHRGEITSVLVSPDGSIALSGGGSQDYRAHSWDLATGACLQAYEGHRHRVFVTGVNDSHALSAGWDGTAHLWDLRSGERIWSDAASQEYLTEEGLRQLRGQEVCSPLDGSIRERLEGLESRLEIYASSRPFGVTKTERAEVWDLEAGRLLAQLPCRVPFPPRPALAGDLFAFALNPRELAVVDLAGGRFLCLWPFSAKITSVAVHPAGKIAVGLDDGQLPFLELIRSGASPLRRDK